jgi:hypothetical protein
MAQSASAVRGYIAPTPSRAPLSEACRACVGSRTLLFRSALTRGLVTAHGNYSSTGLLSIARSSLSSQVEVHEQRGKPMSEHMCYQNKGGNICPAAQSSTRSCAV